MNKPNGGTTQDAFPISPTPIDSLSLHRRTISHGESRTPEYEAWPSDTQDLLDDGLLPRKSEGDHSGTALASAAKLGVQLSSYEKREQIIASDDHERLLFDASSDPDGFAAYQQRDGGTAMHDHHHHNTKDEAHHVRAHSSAVSLGLASEDNGFTSKESFGQRYDSSSSIDTRRSSVLSSNSNDNNKEAAASTVSLASDPSKKSSSGQKRKSRKERERERTRQFAKEMAFVTIPSILLSMLGSVLAGEVLAKLKTWPVFLRVEELFILVPILLNLKGNLEMNLAARFSTSANIGELDLRQTRRSLVLGNMALLQVQALLVSLLAGVVAFLLGLASRTGLTENSPAALAGHDISAYGISRGGYLECLLVLCASMIAASASSAVVGAFMCSLVVVSRFLRINPDNLATPLAASLGDLLALTILGIVAHAGASFANSMWSTVIFLLLVVFIAANVFFTLRNAYVQELIWGGWVPLLLALAVSSGTGLVLQNYVNEYRGFGLIAPVLTGVAGNVAAIFVSRISTALHGAKEERYVLTATTLFAISCPILIAFLGFVWLTGQAKIGVAFVLSYSLLSVVIMALALWLSYHLTFWLWRRDFDPDINALPLMSAGVDLLGQLLLVVAYMLAQALGGDVKSPTPVIPVTGNATLSNATESVVAQSLSRLFLLS